MDVTAAASYGPGLQGVSTRQQLAVFGLKSAMEQQTAVQIITASNEGAAGQAGTAESSASSSGRGRLVDMQV